MNVLLINGSPHKEGCTYTALKEITKVLNEEGIETEIFHPVNGSVWGCAACGGCRKTGYCVFSQDTANTCIDKIKAADGIIIGSPVYYAGPNGALCALLDRIFYASGSAFANKPAAAIVSCRRGGASAAFDRLNKYFTINRMPVVSSQYWNSVHGVTPEEVLQDAEGLQVMRTLGRSMAWLLNSIEKSGLPAPQREPGIMTNFIR